MSPRGPVVVLLGLVILLLPFETVIEIASPGGQPPFLTLGTAADPFLALLAAAVAMAIARGARPSAARPLALGIPMLALLAASLALHPTVLGSMLVLRSAGAFAIAAALTLVTREERVLLAAALLVTAVAQALLGLAQIATGQPLGLDALGERPEEIARVGGALSPRGTMFHPYALASLGLVASGAATWAALRSGSEGRAAAPLRWLIGTAAAMVPVGVAYSRTSLVGVVLGCAALLPAAARSSRTHRMAIAALVLGTAVPALIWNGGWLARGGEVLDRVPDRPILLGQAAQVIAGSPILGIGPGRYLIALGELEQREPGSVRVPQVPHSVPVLIAADGGIAAGALMFAVLAWLAWRAMRAGAAAQTAYVLLIPFVLNEHFLYSTSQGAALLGVWMGIVACLGDEGP